MLICWSRGHTMSFMYSYWLHQLIEIELLWGWSTRCWWSCTSELSYNSYYFISWWDHLLTTLRICVDSITCLDYSILDRRLLLTVDILFTCETWLVILYIYTWQLSCSCYWNLLGILLHGNNARMLYLLYSCYTGILYLDIYYIPVIPVPWLSHVDIVWYCYRDHHWVIPEI